MSERTPPFPLPDPHKTRMTLRYTHGSGEAVMRATSHLTLEEELEILWWLEYTQKSIDDISKMYNVTKRLVTSLRTRAKQNPVKYALSHPHLQEP